MFVRSSMSVPVRYSKSKGSVILKPNAITFVDDALVTAKELKDCYGDRIAILSQDLVEQIIQEEAPAANKESKQDSDTDNTPVNKNDGEGKDENGNDEGASKDEGDESNTGDEDVDNFLNGKTETLPEGTTEITEEEALKLKEEAEAKAKAEAKAEAKAKEEAEKLEALKAKEAEAKTKAKAAKAPKQNQKAGKNK